MLSYQHAYHAGNFADVHKHLTLFAIIDHLLRKKSAVTYIDTHAGRGLYPLAAEETARLGEYREGIDRLWQARALLGNAPLLDDWLAAVERVQARSDRLDHYPGSPWWLSDRLRAQDSLMLFELHPGEHGYLARQVMPDNVQRIHSDGLQGLVKRLPVATPRLCVLVDPSYERKAEYGQVAKAVLEAMRRARHAVVLVWYPLLPAGHHHELLEELRVGGLRKIWRSELRLREAAESERGMVGSGMLVINPPWGLESRLEAAMRQVTPLLGATCRYRSDWWVGE
ncbi:MAG: 23S rRNA (adenine(2030)-N(6))-methyltransferase RlmJ [Halomonas sp.]|uniref:23S rRNA (adenine(2030)-N(6))-methyltransferase RlmJ n=1 Tax=Halomonas sp. TaxID=1486246 RepID=UPI002ACD3170|nr:23S rRNA (adenine(2030)-N(6))-methyltransferase RlmJ [Halomonas sp.]MDZ7851476.1 23S rRNA (adenine(2030)-N(6))-methyltransferase RlmJ [Halomonas sp.]